MRENVLLRSLCLMVKVLFVQVFLLWTMPFNARGQVVDPVISGSVFNDINGNAQIDAGETFTSLPAPLYVYLVSNLTGIVVNSAVVASNGSYSLTANPMQNYALVLSLDQYEIGTNATSNRVTNIPPTGWVHSGVNSNGIYALIVQNANRENVNFGLIDRCSPFAYGNIDSDGDGIPDRCDLDDDNDGILDTDENECLSTVVNPATYPAGFTELVPSDFEIDFAFGVQTNLDLTADLSEKFGYEANSGKIIVKITKAHVHPTANSFYVRGDLPVTDWEISGSIATGTAVEHGMEYFPNQRREIRLYSYESEYANRVPVSGGNWNTGITNNVHYVENNTGNEYVGPGNGAIFIAATLKSDVKRFGLYTNDVGYDRWSTYFVRIVPECDDDKNGISNRLDKDSDGDGCADAVEGTGNFGYEDLNPDGSLSGDVSETGLPVVANSGQGIGTSQNSTQLAAACLVSISGTVWHDINGDAITNITEVGVNPGTLHANLVDASGEVVASVAVSGTGEFTFSNAPAAGTFSVILTNGLKSVGDELSLSEALPGNWVPTGTNVGSVASTTNKTGIIGSIITSGSDISGIDFGVQQRPDSDNKEKVLASQPSVDAILLLNGSDAPLMTGSDDEDGDYIGDRDEDLSLGVVITSLPTNGILQYYRAGSFVEVTVSDVTNGTLFPDPSLFSIKLTAGNYKTTTFQYAYVDAAGVQDLTPASYTISWESPLPVRLISFNAKLEGSVTRLSWTTAEEVNSDYFEVQHSADAKNWVSLAPVAAQGESNEKYDYRYEHASSTGGVNYYSLKMVDKNGTFAMSDIRSITLQNRTSVSVYPNPVSHSFFLKGVDLKMVKSVKVISLAGVTVWETAVVSEAGITVNWGDGLYLVRVEKIDGTSEVLKLLVER